MFWRRAAAPTGGRVVTRPVLCQCREVLDRLASLLFDSTALRMRRPATESGWPATRPTVLAVGQHAAVTQHLIHQRRAELDIGERDDLQRAAQAAAGDSAAARGREGRDDGAQRPDRGRSRALLHHGRRSRRPPPARRSARSAAPGAASPSSCQWSRTYSASSAVTTNVRALPETAWIVPSAIARRSVRSPVPTVFAICVRTRPTPTG